MKKMKKIEKIIKNNLTIYEKNMNKKTIFF